RTFAVWRPAATRSRRLRRVTGSRPLTSVFAEQALQIGVGAALQQRQPQQHARFVRVQIQRRDEPALVVVHLDVAADAAGRHARRAHADDAVLGVAGARPPPARPPVPPPPPPPHPPPP